MFLSCGDALFDVFASAPEGAENKVGRIALAGVAGGSPMNVAVGLARLGNDAHFFTKVSSDLFGQRLKQYLDLNKIGLDLSLTTDLNTTLAIVEKQTDGSAKYAFYTNKTADVSLAESELPASLPAEIGVLHFGSYSTVVDPTASSLSKLAARESANCLVSYDLNLRPTIEPDIEKWRHAFKAFGACARVIKASDEDIATLFGENQEERYVADCFSMGAQLVSITRGGEGSSAFLSDGTSIHAEGIPTKVVDTVGAGDTFQAAMLHWLNSAGCITGAKLETSNLDLADCIAFASKAAAITCTRSGADLPYLADLE